MKDFSFQGKVFLGDLLTTGKPGGMYWVADAALLSIKPSQGEEKQAESYSGLRHTSATIPKALEVAFDLTLTNGLAKNLALGLYGEVQTVAGGSVTAEEFPNPVAVDDIVALDYGNISSLVVTDSNGAPATLVLDTDYALDDANYGRLSMLGLAAYTQPFKAAYDYAGNTDVVMFNQPAPVRYLIMDGLNTVDGSNDLLRLRMYKLKFNPVGQVDFINDSFGDLKLSGTALIEPTAELDSTLGPYGKIALLSE